ncbi:hypothetical protein BH20VER2_BH20VER2_08400 [soil metagenome]
MNRSNDVRRVALVLLVLRLTVFLVMLMWTIDKFVCPGHAVSVFENFYGLRGFGDAVIFGLAGAELLLIFAFVVGFAQRFTYGAVLLLHAISTLSSWRQYCTPFEGNNLLFGVADARCLLRALLPAGHGHLLARGRPQAFAGLTSVQSAPAQHLLEGRLE